MKKTDGEIQTRSFVRISPHFRSGRLDYRSQALANRVGCKNPLLINFYIRM